MNRPHMERGPPKLGDEFWLRGTMPLMERGDAVVLAPGWHRYSGTRAEITRATDLVPRAETFLQ